MRPLYEISDRILLLVGAISEKIGEIKSTQLQITPAELRKKNRVKSIQSSLAIEGNTLTIDQVSTLFDNKRVVGPQKDILEVRNAIRAYEMFDQWKSGKEQSFLKAHRELLSDLTDDNGRYRTKGVGIAKGKIIAHVAPPAASVKGLMKDLFAWLKSSKENVLVKACVFHYELEFIHPFSDGNGRMGRLWQSVILSEKYPVFRFLPVETLIRDNQKAYYKALADSDKAGSSTRFTEFMLGIIDQSLEQLLMTQQITLSAEDRISQLRDFFPAGTFTRQDYMRRFKGISSATASRDLAQAVENKMITRMGDKRTAVYKLS